ncbi:metallophosphoesterase [Chitinophaga barathri]|uniref:Calcineurin-like phosphoesterase domain-containing protein n=1 Tax=Chitinophaga barathri TaxID=1647451 RepID=A0A3N4MVS5_9BACT|nr:metallophosphoesterase [Chitinophaga barathri]RPD39493.1 hypothetical protein EG028_20460 [Chitinophaga barathri]
MKLKILHLSDLHFKSTGLAQDVVVSSLLTAIQELCEKEDKPDLLLLTGDVAFGGKPEEYKKAKEFIDGVADCCGIGKGRIFIIPGNHDVERSRIKPGYVKWWYSFKNEQELHEVLSSEDAFPKVMATTTAYFEFIKSYMDNLAFGRYGEYVAEMPLGNDGLKLKIVGLNSAFFCGYDGDDNKQLALGLPQVACYGQTNIRKEVVLSMVHHPEMCFHYCDNAAWNTVKRKSDLVLSGHIHDAGNSFRRDGNAGETVFIAAGAGYESRSSQNGFNIIEIDPDDLKIKGMHYKYLPERHTWVVNKDINVETDGVFEFSLQKAGHVCKRPEPIFQKSTGSQPALLSSGTPASAVNGFRYSPVPPQPYYKPSYLVNRNFVGRQAELNALDDWASAANPYTVLLFEAMGGTGKSMLTWEWTINQAKKARSDWKGIFWYSFYEKGAIMTDFCRHALAYITGQNVKDFEEMKTPALADMLIPLLSSGAWLVILDGLERVLENYNNTRFAEDFLIKTPEEVENISKKHPCACINDEDDDLLQRLATCTPSKILASSRLVPRALLNVSDQPIPGVLRYLLQGLRPTDAEAMFRDANISGDSAAIQNYLTTNCGCHPLTIGVLVGLIRHYMPGRGNFDKWVNDPAGGGKLNLASLDLVARQNHILSVAMNMLPSKSWQLLSTLTLIYEAVDYSTLLALNPHLPPEPEEVTEPQNPEISRWAWKDLTDKEKEIRKKNYVAAQKRWKNYLEAMENWRNSDEFRAADIELGKTVQDLEVRGLVQYEAQTDRYELHPVVRAVASGRMAPDETREFGQLVVDHFSSRTHVPHQYAKTLEDVSDGLNIVRILLRMGRYEKAFLALRPDLSNTLAFRLEAHNLLLTLLRQFFPNGWLTSAPELNDERAGALLTLATIAMSSLGDWDKTFAIHEYLLSEFNENDLPDLTTSLRNVAFYFDCQGDYATENRILDLALKVSEFSDNQQSIFMCRFFKYSSLVSLGWLEEAEKMWPLLDKMGRKWNYNSYRQGSLENTYAYFQWQKGNLQKKHITDALNLAEPDTNRSTVRSLHWLTGIWHIEKEEWREALESLSIAVSMARVASIADNGAETLLALAKFKLGQLPQPVQEAERLANLRKPAYYALAELWLAIGDMEQVKKHALSAYKKASGNGEPYVYRYWLNKAAALLRKAGAEIPVLPPYDPAAAKIYPWEAKIIALVERLEREQKEKQPG